ncbi:MAG: glycosyltransferase family 2 protein [Patescibacteria group bacterium]|jgi:hypothetical protein
MSNNLLPVSVVIVSFNTSELTKKALKALYESTKLPTEVILVDNNSVDGTVEMVRRDFPQVKMLVNKENFGFAKANNQAIQISTQPYIWLLNSDTETGVKSLMNLYDFMAANDRVGALGPSLVYPDRSRQSIGGYFPTFLNVLGYLFPIGYLVPEVFKKKMKRIALYPQQLPTKGKILDYVTGAACFLRKKALDQCGLLGEEYFMYFEETDLCWRLKKNGWKILAIETDPVMHIYGGSFKTKRDLNRLAVFLNSLIKFVTKNYPWYRAFPIVLMVSLFGKISVYLKSIRSL